MVLDRVELVLDLVRELPWYQWKRISQVIDRLYENKANKTMLADLESVKKALELELKP